MNDDKPVFDEQGPEGGSVPGAPEFHAPVKIESAPLGGSQAKPDSTPVGTQIIIEKDRSALARVRAGLDRIAFGAPGSPSREYYLDKTAGGFSTSRK